MIDPDKLSTASSVGADERRTLLNALVLERRILFGCTLAVGLCSLIWITAVCTESWCTIQGGNGIYISSSKRYFKYSTSGLWKTCRYVWIPTEPTTTAATGVTEAPIRSSSPIAFTNVTITKMAASQTTPPPPPADATLIAKCTNYLASELEQRKFRDPAYHQDIAAYCRTMVSFAIISFIIQGMGFGFSLYTFKNPRYMFKRLAAGIHFIATSCAMVVVQVNMSTVDFEKKHLSFVYPPGAYHVFGPSFFMAWFVMLVNFFAFAAFLWYSKKRKGNKSPTEELAMADEPTIIGEFIKISP